MNKKESLFLFSLLSLALFGLLYATFIAMQPEAAANQFLTGVREYDEQKVNRVASFDDLIGDLPEGELFSASNDEHNLTLFSQLTFEVKSVESKGDNANVRTVIRTIDMQPLYNAVYRDMINKILDNAMIDISERSYYSNLGVESENTVFYALHNGVQEQMEVTVVIPMKRSGLGWRVLIDDNLRSALTSGLVRPDGSTFVDTKTVHYQLYKAFAYAGGTLFTEGFSDINSFVLTESELDNDYGNIEYLVGVLAERLSQKRQYDQFMLQLDDAKYAQVKADWRTLSQTIDTMAAKVEKQLPRYNVKEDLLDEKPFQNALQTFANQLLKMDAMTDSQL
jgi:hypothetical protein